MSEAGSKVVRGLLEALILASLSRGPKHGYALLKELEDMAGEPQNRNKIYPLLARLEAQGHLARGPAETAGGRARTLFSITEDGRAELERFRRLPEPLRGALDELWATPRPAGATAAPVVAPDAGASASPLAPPDARPPAVPEGTLPYPCPDARVTVEKDPRTGTLGVRITGCPMGAFSYCPLCPVSRSVEGLRRITLG